MILAAALVWVALIWGASAAVSAPGVQTVSDRSGEWAGDVLGVTLEPRLVVITNRMYYPDSLAEVDAGDPGRYRIRPAVAASVRRMRFTVNDYGRQSMNGLHVVLHERLHRTENAACWDRRGTEEGITDALAVDLLPALAQYLYRERVAFWPLYVEQVREVRLASRYATGARTWRERRPRLWRRALWQADCEGRARMLGAAAAAREAA